MSTTSPRRRGSCLEKGLAGQIWNVADDEPAPPQDVIAYAADASRRSPPPEEPFETAELSPMAASFYAETKRVSNAKAKALLGFAPAYPTYREGLRALWEAGEGRDPASRAGRSDRPDDEPAELPVPPPGE